MLLLINRAFLRGVAMGRCIQFVLALVPALAWADCPKADQRYAVHIADVNSDGVLDYAVVPRPTFFPLPIDDDLTIIVPVPSRAAGFVLASQAGGARSLQALSGNRLPDGNWQGTSLPFIVADLAGAGCNALVLRGAVSATAPGSTDTVVVRFSPSGEPTGMQVLTSRTGGYGLGDGELRAADQNGDGRQDLLHKVEGLVQGVYLADAQSVLGLDPPATVMAVWADFVAAASARDERAVRYLGTAVVDLYGSELTADALEAMCQGIRMAGIESISDRGASVVVQRAGVDGDDLYTVLFGRTENGSWRIAGL